MNERIVSQFDPAYDKAKSTPDNTVLVEGKTPVAFIVRELELEELVEVLEVGKTPTQISPAQATRAFRLGIVAIEGSSLGSPSWRPVNEVATMDGGTRPSPSWPDMRAIRNAVGITRMLDVGETIIKRAISVGNGVGGAG